MGIGERGSEGRASEGLLVCTGTAAKGAADRRRCFEAAAASTHRTVNQVRGPIAADLGGGRCRIAAAL